MKVWPGKQIHKTTMIVMLSMTVLLTGLLYSPEPAAAAAGWKWTEQSGKESTPLNDVVGLSNGVIFAIGDDSTIQRRVSEGEWRIQSFPQKANLKAAADNGTTAIVVGDHGVLARTKDGVSWESGKIQGNWLLYQFNDYFKNKPEGKTKLNALNTDWHDVIWDGEQFVASGEVAFKFDSYNSTFPAVAISKQGVSWELVPLITKEHIATWDPYKLVKFQNKWIVKVDKGVFVSQNLKSWTYHRNPKFYGSIDEFATNGKVVVAVGWDGSSGSGQAIGGVVYTSTDGINYKAGMRISNVALNSVSWDGEQFIVGGRSGYIMQSYDGLTWKEKTQERGSTQAFFAVHNIGLEGNINRLKKFGSQYIGVGDGGVIRTAKGLDEKWSLEAAGKSNDLYGIAYSRNAYVIAGVGTILTSTDGSRWSAAESAIIPETSFYSLTSGNGMFIPYGISSSPSQESFLYTNGQLQSLTGIVKEHVDNISIINGQIRIITETEMKTSTDGENWSSTPGLQPVPVAANGKIWIGYYEGESSYYKSTDGMDWKKTEINLDGKKLETWNGSIQKSIWTGSKFIGINRDSILESSNGTSWKTVLPLKNAGFKDLAVSGDGTVTAVGLNGMIYMADRGANWKAVYSPTLKELKSITWDGKQFLAVGSSGVILRGIKE